MPERNKSALMCVARVVVSCFDMVLEKNQTYRVLPNVVVGSSSPRPGLPPSTAQGTLEAGTGRYKGMAGGVLLPHWQSNSFAFEFLTNRFIAQIHGVPPSNQQKSFSNQRQQNQNQRRPQNRRERVCLLHDLAKTQAGIHHQQHRRLG